MWRVLGYLSDLICTLLLVVVMGGIILTSEVVNDEIVRSYQARIVSQDGPLAVFTKKYHDLDVYANAYQRQVRETITNAVSLYKSLY